ncbi:hypothetical protein [Thermodesulfatator atlanticus]|uniref:hypothetical protein n=1 Tax=Thermodesulfatator atlanticus TaxID=501497 RepID=UPI0012FAA84A|nr:hypothetical protein [Thermodesulfatator atlanticus]
MFETHRVALLEDQELNELLCLYEKAFERVQEEMKKTGAFEFCAECGRAGLSCCGNGMELDCDDILLVLNLLAGVRLPQKRKFPLGCFFLSETGCILKLRPLICRNFLCQDLKNAIGLANTIQIQQSLDEEAVILFKLTQRVKALLSKTSQAA